MTALVVTFRDGTTERIEFDPLGLLVVRGSPFVSFGDRPSERLLSPTELAGVSLVDVDEAPLPGWTYDEPAKPKPRRKAAA